MTQQTVTKQRKPIQISLSVLMLMTLLFAVASAGLFHAARIPEIQEEIAAIMGTTPPRASSRRGPQIAFILFTLTSPMILAIVVSSLSKFTRR